MLPAIAARMVDAMRHKRFPLSYATTCSFLSVLALLLWFPALSGWWLVLAIALTTAIPTVTIIALVCAGTAHALPAPPPRSMPWP